MGRSVDMAVVEWARAYAPFDCTVVKNTRKHKCDFCGEPHAGRIVRMHCRQKDQDLFGCFGCNCLVTLLGDAQCATLHLSAMNQGVGLISDADVKEAQTEGERLRQAMVAKEAGDVHTVMTRVKLLFQQGHGKGWRILPDLIRQYNERKSLSPRQLEVCLKFLKSCE